MWCGARIVNFASQQTYIRMNGFVLAELWLCTKKIWMAIVMKAKGEKTNDN